MFVTWQKSLANLPPHARNFLHLCGFIDQRQLRTSLFKDATRTKYAWDRSGSVQPLPP